MNKNIDEHFSMTEDALASGPLETKTQVAQSSCKHRTDSKPTLTTSKIISYAAPVTGSYFFYIPMLSILPGVYGKYFGLDISAMAAAMLFIRLFDGVTDPLIGYLADCHRAKNGSRKVWVICGGILTIVSCYFLFSPSSPTTVTYFMLWSFAYYLAFTISDVPHLVWGSELTRNYDERTRIYGIRAVAYKLGILLFYSLPLLPFYESSAYTPEVFNDAVMIGAVLTLIGLTLTWFKAPEGKSTPSTGHDSFLLIVKSITQNKPLQVYFLTYIFTGISYGMWFGLLYFYLGYYLALDESIALMFTIGTFLSMVTAPLWPKLVSKSSKPIVWALGTSLFIVQLIGMALIGPDTPLWISTTLIIFAYAAFACHNIAPFAILGDIIDYGKMKFNKDRGATYFAMNNVLYKMSLGIGSGLALAVVGIFGFDPSIQTPSESAITGLRIGFIYIPAITATIGIVFILQTPINRRRYRIIEQRIFKRQK